MDVQLTKPGLEYSGSEIDPLTGMPYATKKLAFFKNAGERINQFVKDATQQVHPSESNVSGVINEPETQYQTEAGGPLHSTDVQPHISSEIPTSNVPKFFKPSFAETTTDSSGLPLPVSAGETKLGKLAHIVLAAGKGAAEAAGTPDFGTGYRMAGEAPVRDAMLRENLKGQQLENATRQASLSLLPISVATQSAQLANLRADINWKNAHAAYYDAIKDVKDMPTLAQLHAQAAQKALQAGRDPATDPETQAYADQITSIQRQSVPKDTATTLKEEKLMNPLFKMAQAGEITDAMMTNVTDLSRAIRKSKHLTSKERNDALSYLASTNTPASQGSLANIRLEGLASTRGMMVYDKARGVARPATWQEISNAAPGTLTGPQYEPDVIGGVAVARSLAAGKDKENITSFNQLLGHIASMRDLIENLRETGVPWLNKPYNELRANLEGDPDITEFVAAMEPVRKEYMTYLLNGRALYSDDRDVGMQLMNENLSPDQMERNSKRFVHTAAVRLGSSNASYKRIKHVDIPDLLTPDAEGILSFYAEHIPGYGGAGGGGPQMYTGHDSTGKPWRFTPEQWEKNKAKIMERDPGFKLDVGPETK